MNILMFGWEFPPHNSGGLGVACWGLTHALSDQNAHIDFVLPKSMPVDSDFLHMIFADVASVKTHQIKTLLRPYITSEKYLSSLSQLIGKNIYGDTLFEEVERYAHEGGRIAAELDNFEIIHAHDWLTFGAGMQAQEATAKPLVVHVHATEFDRGGGQGIDERVYAIEQAGMKQANRVIAVSQLTKNIITHKYGIASSKVDVVHNGIDPSWYRLGSPALYGLEEYKKLGYKVVLFVGRITLQKGVDYLLHAAKMALKHDPKILFVIAGSGDMERQIIQLAANLGISGNILFAGFVRDEKLSAIYKSADLLVMPSVSEPFGLIALESLVHGTPVLVSKQSGVAEVLTHALKVDFWDTEEMANKIITAVRYPGLNQTLAQNGQVEAHKNSWDKAATKCLNIYNQLV